ncbi:MAG: HupE/UreJ family protein [Bryobacterales bacterium]
MYAFRTMLLSLALAGLAQAHDIPAQAVVRMLAKPSGGRLQVLVRAPLRTMRDVEVPTLATGYLDTETLAPQLSELAKTWIAPFVEAYENSERLPAPQVAAAQLSIVSDRSFASFDKAVTRVRAPLPPSSDNLVWEQLFFDVLLEFPIQSETSDFAIRPGLEHLAERVTTTLTAYTAGGEPRSFQLAGEQGATPFDPSWSQTAWRFGKLGFEHILDGRDHLLFLACLVIPFRRLRTLALIVTAFTAAHSITLVSAALGFAPDALWFPPLVETLIAATILYMALENIFGAKSERRRWMFAFGFGLIHGFGFAFALRESLQFAGNHLATSLLAFNVGVEAGQLLVIVLLAPLLDVLFRFVVEEKTGVIVASAFIAHTSWHWLVERWEILQLYEIDPGWAWRAAAWLAASLAATAAVRFAAGWRHRLHAAAAPDS